MLWPHPGGGFGLRTPNAPLLPAAARPHTWGMAPASRTESSPAGATAPAVQPPALRGVTVLETGRGSRRQSSAAGSAVAMSSPPLRGSICHQTPEACTAIGDRPQLQRRCSCAIDPEESTPSRHGLWGPPALLSGCAPPPRLPLHAPSPPPRVPHLQPGASQTEQSCTGARGESAALPAALAWAARARAFSMKWTSSACSDGCWSAIACQAQEF